LIMLWEVFRYFQYGRIHRYFVAPKFYFKYYGFGWVEPWPGFGMEVHFIVMGLLAAAIAAGMLYRVATVLFFLAFTYVFLLDQVCYLNHFYLVCLYSFLMIIVPAHRAFSVDASVVPRLRSPTAPAWSLWILRTQMCVVYFMGGIAKINADWLRGEPMRIWLAERSDFPLLGRFFHEEWMVYLFSYGGLLFDLFIPAIILTRRTPVRHSALTHDGEPMKRLIGLALLLASSIALAAAPAGAPAAKAPATAPSSASSGAKAPATTPSNASSGTKDAADKMTKADDARTAKAKAKEEKIAKMRAKEEKAKQDKAAKAKAGNEKAKQ